MSFFGVFNSFSQTFNSQRILGSYIDITLLSTDCKCCNCHSFKKFMRIALHNRSVHKCTGVAFVTVAYNVGFSAFVCCRKTPFASCGEAAAASAAGAQLVVIRRPPEQGETAEEVLKRCKEMIR